MIVPKTIKPSDYELNKVADDLKKSIAPFYLNPYLQGQVLENISLSATNTNVIEHKLGRPIRFWTIVRGPILSDTYTTQDVPWTQYTPTVTHNSGGITNVTHTVHYKTIGDSIIIRGRSFFSSTSAAFTGLNYSLPNLWTRSANDFNFEEMGSARCFDAGSTGYGGYVSMPDTSKINIALNAIFTHAGTVYIGDAPITNLAPFTFNTNDKISFFTRPIPITQLQNNKYRDVWEVTGEFNDKFLYLKTTVDCTVSLYVG